MISAVTGVIRLYYVIICVKFLFGEEHLSGKNIPWQGANTWDYGVSSHKRPLKMAAQKADQVDSKKTHHLPQKYRAEQFQNDVWVLGDMLDYKFCRHTSQIHEICEKISYGLNPV